MAKPFTKRWKNPYEPRYESSIGSLLEVTYEQRRLDPCLLASGVSKGVTKEPLGRFLELQLYSSKKSVKKSEIH